MTFGEKMKKIRTEKCMSQQELGERLGVKQQTVAQYEKAPDIPKYNTVRRIACALDCPISTLVEDENIFPLDDVKDSLIFGGIISRVVDNMMHLSFEAMTKLEEYSKDLREIPKYEADWTRKDNPDTPK